MWKGPEESGTTFSLLSSFLENPEAAALSYIDGLTPKKIYEPFEFGSIMHYALEHQFAFGTPEECIHSITSQYRNWRIPTLLHQGERDTLEGILSLAELTFPPYCRYWAADDKKIEWIARESKFKIPYEVQTPEGPRKVLFRGMRDGVYRVPKTGKLGIFETKNKSKIDDAEIRDGLKADMQTLFYSFVTFLELGEMPEQVTYNIIRRCTVYKRKGRGKNAVPETQEAYMKRVKQDIDKHNNQYYIRYAVDLLHSDINYFVTRTLNPLLVAFIQWHDSLKKNPLYHERWAEGNRSPYHFLNLNGLQGKYGKSQMWEFIVNGNLRHYRVRQEVFPELEDSFLVIP